MKKGFTVIELVIVISIIAIVSAILIPRMMNGYGECKENIVEIYNGSQVRIIDVDTEKVIYEGDNKVIDGYTLVDIKYHDGTIIMYVRKN